MSSNAEGPGFRLNGFPDEEAFTEFYNQTAPRLRGYVYKVTGNTMEADDILQMAYLRLLRAPAMEDAHRMAYLFRAASSLIVDRWRGLDREQRHLSRERVSAALQSDAAESLDLRRLFDQLNERERTLLCLAYKEGFDHREISKMLGMKEKSVRVLLFRVREKAKAILRPHKEQL